ncbi:hypothetical protein II582_04545 [bacterium]|nr:hypothetical protein [bacterium]
MLSSAHRSSREIIVIQGKSRSFAKEYEIVSVNTANMVSNLDIFFICNKNW